MQISIVLSLTQTCHNPNRRHRNREPRTESNSELRTPNSEHRVESERNDLSIAKKDRRSTELLWERPVPGAAVGLRRHRSLTRSYTNLHLCACYRQVVPLGLTGDLPERVIECCSRMCVFDLCSSLKQKAETRNPKPGTKSLRGCVRSQPQTMTHELGSGVGGLRSWSRKNATIHDSKSPIRNPQFLVYRQRRLFTR